MTRAAFQQLTLTDAVKANADLGSYLYHFVNVNSSGKAVAASTAGQKCEGILQNTPDAANRSAEIALEGISKLELGGTVAYGDDLTTDASAKGVKATSEEYVRAVALSSGVSGDIIPVRLVDKGVRPSHLLALHINLVDITADGDVVTTFTPGFAGTIESVNWIQGSPVTTADDAADLNLEIGTTDITGGVVSLTSATATPLGKVIAGTAVTAANTFTATDTISVKASSVTAFAEGDGMLVIKYSQDA